MSEHVDLSFKPLPESDTASTITSNTAENEQQQQQQQEQQPSLLPTTPMNKKRTTTSNSIYNNKKKTNSLRYKMKPTNELHDSFETMDLNHIPPTSQKNKHISSSLSPVPYSYINNNNNSKCNNNTNNNKEKEKEQENHTTDNHNNPNVSLDNNYLSQRYSLKQPMSINQHTSSPPSSSAVADFPLEVNNIHSTLQQQKQQPKQALRTVPIRNYEQFPGNNVFFCNGRILTNRAFWAFIITIILLCGPCILFAIFVCPWLWYNISPAVPILFGYIFTLCFASMIKTSWTDPGILPRNLYAPSIISTKDRFGHAYELQHEPPPPIRDIIIKGEVTQLKYCDTCGIYRPPRASHCRQCNNCVEHEDHHCIWLNNCIGRRNYRSFFTFIVTASILCIYVFSFSLVQLVSLYLNSGTNSFQAILSETPISLLLTILCFLLAIPVVSLTGYHCFLTMRGVTTHEQLRYSIAMKPFEKHLFDFGNPLLNFNYALCRPRAKSYLARRKYMQERYNINDELDHNQIIEPQNINQPSSSSSSPQFNTN
ncbi:DHHC palmitoyltransferase-domain-containing protein [Cunninghamella echinulata]|nr:DHHC palmitoyltransferase-domain-containing protein [Cunninghamella echinulata]